MILIDYLVPAQTLMEKVGEFAWDGVQATDSILVRTLLNPEAYQGRTQEEKIQACLIENGFPDAQYRIVDPAQVPVTKEFRMAWTRGSNGTTVVDLQRAKRIKKAYLTRKSRTVVNKLDDTERVGRIIQRLVQMKMQIDNAVALQEIENMELDTR